MLFRSFLSGRFAIGEPRDTLHIEARFPRETIDELERRGHLLDRWGDFNELAGHAHGIVIDGKRYSAAQHPAAVPLPHGELHLGRTRLRIRTSLETLAAERPDHTSPDAPWLRDAGRIAGIAAAAGVAQLAYTNWLDRKSTRLNSSHT